ncbi:MAG: aminoglycoside phosphotransferase family protein [Candidatus Dormiibacterota bacterium]
MTEQIAASPEVHRMVSAAHGERGRRWLAELPALVTALAERWSLRLGPAFSGGAVAYAALVVLENGSEAVLKVTLAEEESRGEGAALRHWDGDGAIRVLDEDRRLGALLLERCRPGRSLAESAGVAEAVEVLAGILPRLWAHPAAEQHEFPLGAKKARDWSARLAAGAGMLAPLGAADLADRGAGVAETLSVPEYSPAPGPVVVNRDLHPGNVLSAAREPWLLIDPKPLVGEPAFDCGHLVRQLLWQHAPRADGASEVTESLAQQLDLDPLRVRGWAFVRSIENALWAVETGYDSPLWEVECARALLQAGV